MGGPILYNRDGSVVEFAWPGGYRMWYVTNDASLLCGGCVEDNLDECTDSEHPYNGWLVEGYTHSGEMDDPDWARCDHCAAT